MAPLIRANEELLAEVTARLWPDLDPAALAALQPSLWGTVHGLATLVSAGHLPADAVEPSLRVLMLR